MIESPIKPRGAMASAIALVFSALSGFPGPAAAQLPDSCLICPVPNLSFSSTNRQVNLIWDEIPTTEGRRISSFVKEGFDSLSAEFDLVGTYSLDCDYRLNITKIPEPSPAFNKNVRIIYEIQIVRAGTFVTVQRDTVHMFQPNTDYLFRPSIAADLGVRAGPNITQPPTGLGNSVVTVSGLNTTNDPRVVYEVVAVNSVSSLADGLQVRVAGPLPVISNTPVDTLLVTAANTPIGIMEGMQLSFSDGSVTAGDSLRVEARRLFPPAARVRANLEVFEGYRVWRAELPNPDTFVLLGEIRHCESKFEFILLNEEERGDSDITLRYDGQEFTLTDNDVHNDFPYNYGVNTFDRGFLGNPENVTLDGDLATTGKFYPANPTRDQNDMVYTVPNPYKSSADWEEGDRKLVFANLPTRCTVRIFTVAAEHIQTFQHGPGESATTSETSATWNLQTASGETVAPGIYIFYVDGTNTYDRSVTGGGTETVTEPFQQTGKMMIVR